MVKKNSSPLLSIVLGIAILFTLVEGTIYFMGVVRRSQNSDMEALDQKLTMLVDVLAEEVRDESDLEQFYENLYQIVERELSDIEWIVIYDAENNPVYGLDKQVESRNSLRTYQSGQDFFDDFSFLPVIAHFMDADILRVSNQHIDGSFLDQMEDYEFVYPEIIYYSKTISIHGRQDYEVVFAKKLSVSGRTLQQMVYTLLIHLTILLILWIISGCQSIVRNADFRRLQKIAYYDELTNLPNRKLFEIDAANLLKKRGEKKYAMITMDVCNFKVVNDFFGDEVGDAVLRGIAEKLQKEAGKDELAARDQADIFLFLFSYESLEKLDDRIKRFDTKLVWEFTEQAIHFKYGVYPIEDNEEIARLINYSSMARDRADQSKTSNISYLKDAEYEKLRWEKVLEGEMEDALMKKEFAIYLQPKFYTDGTGVGGAEALVRWISPIRGKISPGDFIPLFEKNGYIIKLDDYMLEEVCKKQRKWLSEGKKLLPISVNVSRAHLKQQDLVEDIIAIVDRYDLPHSCIELELTESAFFDDKEILVQTIKKMQAAGFTVSMDDFGTGYSSLNSLKDLPLDVIKLDAEFFKEAMDPKRGQTIVKNTIEMAKNLNMKIVAEGIEKESQVTFLNEIGCDLIQGFYFAKPMTLKEFEMLVCKE